MINMVQILKQLQKIEEKEQYVIRLVMFSDGSGELCPDTGEDLQFDDLEELEKIMKDLLK